MGGTRALYEENSEAARRKLYKRMLRGPGGPLLHNQENGRREGTIQYPGRDGQLVTCPTKN